MSWIRERGLRRGEQGGRTDVPSLRENDPKRECDEEHGGAYPAVCDIRRDFVKVGLVDLESRVSASLLPLPSRDVPPIRHGR